MAPPAELVAQLAELRLATPIQAARVARQAQRLCRGLPLLDHAWVEALVQSGRLTPFQGAEIHAGRGRQLLVGDWLLERPLTPTGFAHVYLARRRSDHTRARLVLAPCSPALRPRVLEQLKLLAAANLNGFPRLLEAGADVRGVWSAWTVTGGTSLATLLQRHGRLPIEAASELARQLAAQLARLEQAGRIHGDLRATHVLIAKTGAVQLVDAGLRPAVRPVESLTDPNLSSLPMEYLDGLAPERAALGSQPTVASDLFAYGCLCWQAVCGRTPTPPAPNAVERLARIAGHIIPDIRRMAPDAPPALVEAIRRMTRSDPLQRPRSFAEVSELLGPPTAHGRRRLRRCLAARNWSWSHGPTVEPVWSSQRARWLAAVAALLLVGAWAFLSLSRSVTPPVEPSNAALAAATFPAPGPAEAASASFAIPPAEKYADRAAQVEEPGELAHPPAAPLDNNFQPSLDAAGPPRVDESVRPAAHIVAPPPTAAVLLPVGRPLRVRALNLKAGQTVCSQDEGRPLVIVPAQGLAIRADDVTLRGIDFVVPTDRPSDAPLLDVSACRVRFEDCTFQGPTPPNQTLDRPSESAGLPTAISWRPTGGAELNERASPQLTLVDCAWRNVSCGILVAGDARKIAAVNSLHLGPGPWVQIAERADEARHVTLRRCTLRGANCLIQLPQGDVSNIAVALDLCVLAPVAGGCVIQTTPSEDAFDAGLFGRYEVADCLLSRDCRGAVALSESPATAADASLTPFTEQASALLSFERHDLQFAGAANDALPASLLLDSPGDSIGAVLSREWPQWDQPGDSRSP